MTLFLVRKGEKVIGIFDDLSHFFPPEELPEGDPPTSFKNYIIEKLELNQVMIKANQIIFKGKHFTLATVDEPIPLLDVSDPSFL